jgi:hypothetical protein
MPRVRDQCRLLLCERGEDQGLADVLSELLLRLGGCKLS